MTAFVELKDARSNSVHAVNVDRIVHMTQDLKGPNQTSVTIAGSHVSTLTVKSPMSDILVDIQVAQCKAEADATDSRR